MATPTDDTKQSSTTYIPLPDGKSSPEEKALFANEAEYYVHTKDAAANTTVLTVLDDYSIGENGDFPDDTSSPSTRLFVEGLTVAGKFGGQKIHISANHLSSISGSVDVTGQAYPVQAPTASGDGNPGQPGRAAGAITLYCEAPPAAASGPKLVAQGGPGQKGQDTSGGTGGAGGKGGSGGQIVVYAQSPYLRAARDLRMRAANIDGLGAIANMVLILQPFDPATVLADGQTLGQLSASLRSLGAQLFPDPAHPNVPIAPSQATPIIVKIGAAVTNVVTSFSLAADNTKTGILGMALDSPGTPGDGGSGSAKNGLANSNGPDPTAGSVAVHMFPDTSALDPAGAASDNLAAALAAVNLTQCQMLLAKASMTYIQADAVQNKPALQAAPVLFQRLVQRLAFVPAWVDSDGTPKDPRVQPYVAIYTAAQANLANLSKGLDYWGQPLNAVPLVDISVYKDNLPGLTESFEKIESVYATYFSALQEQNQTRDQIMAAKAGAQSQITQASSNIAFLSSQMENIAAMISNYDTPITQKRMALDLMLESAVSDINSYYNFTFADGFSLFKDLLGALSSVAFMPESAMMRGVQGTSAVGDLINGLIVQPTTTITNDQGVVVNKDYLVNQVKAVKNSVDGLSESYRQLDDGQLQPDDPGAAKLLVLESQFDQIMGDFKQELPDDITAIQKAFDDYVATIVERNNMILQYNACVNVFADAQAQIDSAQALIAQVNDASFDTIDPGLPELVQTVSQYYRQSRTQLLRTFYEASRALQFWALSNQNFFAQALAANGSASQPSSITYEFINGALTQAWLNGLAAMGTDPTPFPHDPSRPGPTIAYTDDLTLATFRSQYAVTVKMPLIRRPTHGGRTPNRLDPAWQDQLLVDQANIRLGQMRVWLDGARVLKNGAEVDAVLQIKITHGAYSLLASPSDQVYRFVHGTVDKTFQYHTCLKDNAGRPVVEMVANFGDCLTDSSNNFMASSNSLTASSNNQSNFALLSPFTDWTIQLINTIDQPTQIPLTQAVSQGLVKKDVLLSFGSHQYPITSVSVDGGVTTVTVSLYGVPVAVFKVDGQTVTDKTGKTVTEPTVVLPVQSTIDLSQLSAIRFEFTGTSYTFTG